MNMNILLPVDNPKAFHRALWKALTVPHSRDQCFITVMHVHRSVPPMPVGMAGYSIATDLAVRMREEGAQLLHQAGERLQREGVRHETVLRSGDPAVEICDYAREEGVDLIVMGCREKGFLERLFLDSVSQKVVRDAKVPVLVVK